MAPKARTYSPWTVDAIGVLGRQITAARRMHKWTQEELATRAGISVPTLIAIEKGALSPAIGTVFEVAALLGIPLIGATDAAARELIDTRLALLPSRVDTPREDYDDDF